VGGWVCVCECVCVSNRDSMFLHQKEQGVKRWEKANVGEEVG